jgi:hypothetical protein
MRAKRRVWPAGRAPGKREIERMYEIAYTLDPRILRPEDIVDLGLDLHRLKEFGRAEMKKDPAALRRHVPDLWRRMDSNQRATFLMGSLLEGLESLKGIVDGLEHELGELTEVREAVDRIYYGLYPRVSPRLRKRLEEGRARWSTNGDP